MDRQSIVANVTAALTGAPAAFAVRNARRVDARGIERHSWAVAGPDGTIAATGTRDDDFETACRAAGIDPASEAVVDADGRLLTPGYVDIHAHGSW